MISTIKEFLTETQDCESKTKSIVKHGISRKFSFQEKEKHLSGENFPGDD